LREREKSKACRSRERMKERRGKQETYFDEKERLFLVD